MTAIKNGTLLVKDSNGNTARVATLSQTDITTLNTALTDIEANKKKINSISANYVTTNTVQAITGTKVIKSSSGTPIFLQDTRFDRDISPEQDIFNSIIFTDKNAKNAGFIQSVQRKDSNNAFYLAATRDKEGNTDIASLGVVFPRDTTKVAYATAPQTPASASNNEIATAKFVNDKINSIGSNYVTTNTVQNITAIKTIALPSNRHAIIVKDTGSDNTVTPASTQWQSMTIAVDKNGKERACCQATLDTGGYSRTKLMAIQQDSNGNNIYNNLELAIKPDGTRHTYLSSSPASNSNDTSIATTAWVRSYIMPAGVIIPFAGSSIPAGYLLCNGAVVSRTTYAKLFKVIGTTYGAGDGSTTFNLPDLRDRFLEGAGTNAIGRYLSAGLPNITGDSNVAAYWDNRSQQTGCYLKSKDWSQTFSLIAKSGNMSSKVFVFDANSSNTTYGSSSTVQPKSMVVQYLIKY